ncbi:protein of unknown function [Hyphomicrobium sp. 1Nfss2.1]|uniref:hypothetical protein n=1 Tax=Hyphomicrobium sp. 1Nfss2.1 TaxID=3413936 RepID=UPI003C7E286F
MSTSPRGERPRKPSGIFLDSSPEAFTAEYTERMIASAAGLPRICALKKCRRRSRCFGPYAAGLPCTRHHQGLCQARFAGALALLGWSLTAEDTPE